MQMSKNVQMSSDIRLPFNAQALHLNMDMPEEGHSELLAGYESQGQGDPWSWRFIDPWLELWRPNFSGLYCFAIRFERSPSTRYRVVEAWFRGDLVRSPLGPDLSLVLKALLEIYGGYDPEERKRPATPS